MEKIGSSDLKIFNRLYFLEQFSVHTQKRWVVAGTPNLKQYLLRQEDYFSHRLTCQNTSQCIQKRTKRETNCEDLLGSHFGHCAVAHS